MSETTQAFSHASGSGMGMILQHMVIIAIEWGVLHSTPLGPMLTGFFGHLWSDIGFDFAAKGLMADCHLYGAEMLCH